MFVKTEIPDVVIIEPKVFGDDRGYFLESFNQKKFDQEVGKTVFVQDNESKSSKGVLRGLHFQRPPFAQAKLVRCIEGEVVDIVVDLRKESPTYKKWMSISLTGENKKQVFVPRGCAHGFVVLSDSATFAYKVDNDYAPDYDAGIAWNDPGIGVNWQLEGIEPQLSGKDLSLKPLSEIENPF